MNHWDDSALKKVEKYLISVAFSKRQHGKLNIPMACAVLRHSLATQTLDDRIATRPLA